MSGITDLSETFIVGGQCVVDKQAASRSEGTTYPCSTYCPNRTAARFEGVVLTAREMAHRLNNHLMRVVGALDVIQAHPDLTKALAPLIDMALEGAASAAVDIAKLQQVRCVETKDTPVGPALDLDRSVEASTK